MREADKIEISARPDNPEEGSPYRGPYDDDPVFGPIITALVAAGGVRITPEMEGEEYQQALRDGRVARHPSPGLRDELDRKPKRTR